jgi:hypothetical protein
MPNKDFEKQVKQKMDELHFIPSDLVWQKVEEQIVEHKKRRRILVWLPLLVLLVTAGTLLYKSNSATHKLRDSAAATTATNNQMKKDVDDVVADKSTGIKNGPFKKDNSETGKNTLSLQDTNIPGTEKTLAKQADNLPDHKSHANTHFIKQKNRQTFEENNSEAITETGLTAFNPANNDRNAVFSTKTIDSAIGKMPDSAARKTIVTKNENKTDSNPVVANKETVTDKKKDLEWGITTDAGLSGISQGFSGFLRSSSSAVAYYTNNPSGVYNSSTAQPSEIRPGAAYSVGLSGRKKYSRTFSLFAGINYSYYSTRINVGQKTDSTAFINQGSLGLQSVNSFYRTGSINSHNYTNHYHFVELPIGIEKQLGNGSAFSVNTGFTVSQLINSNALHYDEQKGIYYQDNKLINKTQLGFFAGISYRLGQKNTSMEIGPQFQYGFTNLYKKEFYGSRHLIFVAVSARLFFHRKKH